jgi:hypothetical protein
MVKNKTKKTKKKKYINLHFTVKSGLIYGNFQSRASVGGIVVKRRQTNKIVTLNI